MKRAARLIAITTLAVALPGSPLTAGTAAQVGDASAMSRDPGASPSAVTMTVAGTELV